MTFPKSHSFLNADFKPCSLSPVSDCVLHIIFYFDNSIIIVFKLYLLPFYRRENKCTKKKTRFHVLVKSLLLALAALESVVLEAWTFACSHEPGVWLHLDKGNDRCYQPFIFSVSRVFWLWLLPEPMETTLAESLKTHFNHNKAPSTKINPFKSVPA